MQPRETEWQLGMNGGKNVFGHERKLLKSWPEGDRCRVSARERESHKNRPTKSGHEKYYLQKENERK